MSDRIWFRGVRIEVDPDYRDSTDYRFTDESQTHAWSLTYHETSRALAPAAFLDDRASAMAQEMGDDVQIQPTTSVSIAGSPALIQSFEAQTSTGDLRGFTALAALSGHGLLEVTQIARGEEIPDSLGEEILGTIRVGGAPQGLPIGWSTHRVGRVEVDMPDTLRPPSTLVLKHSSQETIRVSVVDDRDDPTPAEDLLSNESRFGESLELHPAEAVAGMEFSGYLQGYEWTDAMASVPSSEARLVAAAVNGSGTEVRLFGRAPGPRGARMRAAAKDMITKMVTR